MTRAIAECCVPRMGGRPPFRPGGECAIGLEHYHTAQDDSISVIAVPVWTSTGKQLITPALPGGTYRFGIYYLAGATRLGGGEWNVDLNGGGHIWPRQHRQEFWSDDERDTFYRIRYLTLLPGVQTFTLEAREWGGEVVTTYETMMELWAVPPSASGQCIEPCVTAQQNLSEIYVVNARTLTTRQLITPALEAGVYRLEVAYVFDRPGGSACQFNVDHAGVDIFPRDTLNRPNNADDAVRLQVRELNLGAGVHTFTLVLDTTSSTTYELEQTSWYLHRVDGT